MSQNFSCVDWICSVFLLYLFVFGVCVFLTVHHFCIFCMSAICSGILQHIFFQFAGCFHCCLGLSYLFLNWHNFLKLQHVSLNGNVWVIVARLPLLATVPFKLFVKSICMGQTAVKCQLKTTQERHTHKTDKTHKKLCQQVILITCEIIYYSKLKYIDMSENW